MKRNVSREILFFRKENIVLGPVRLEEPQRLRIASKFTTEIEVAFVK